MVMLLSLLHLKLFIVTCMQSYPHKYCPSVENKVQTFLLLRKSVGNNSVSFAFSVDSKRTDRHLKLNAVSVGLFITSTACCQKLVLVVGKLVVGLSEITEASCLKNNVMYKAHGQVPELSWFSVFSL